MLMGAIYIATESKRYVRLADKLFVVCSTSIICDTVKQIAGDHVCIKGLMGPGVDPHLYRATESDVYVLSSTDLVFYNGLHLEGKMAEILEHMNSYVPTVAVAKAIPKDRLLASEFEGIYDPHIWHDVSLWILVVEEIKNQLIKYDPIHAKQYEENAVRYSAKLKELDRYIHMLCKKLSTKTMVTAHDAFAYFGKAYGFEVVGLQGISTDAQISTKDIVTITQKILDYKIPAIFLESSIPSRTIQAVQQAVESRGQRVAIAPELFSDALGDSSTTADTYHGMINHNINTIVDSLTN